MAATVGRLPVYMRIGNSAEHEVGTIEVDLIDGQVTPETNLAGLFRAAADQIDKDHSKTA
jgi:hypothetical protein